MPKATTSDDAVLDVSLMVFYELRDIDKMLNMTNDPIANFINAVQADVLRFASTRTFEQFKQTCGALSDLDSYSVLMDTARNIGYAITAVVCRGYTSTAKLQELSDRAIMARTRMILNKENQVQQQEIADLVLESERQRAAKEMELENLRSEQASVLEHNENEHAQQVKQEVEEYVLAKQEARKAKELELDMLKSQHTLSMDAECANVTNLFAQTRLDIQTDFIRGMMQSGVQVDEVLIARATRADKVIKYQVESKL